MSATIRWRPTDPNPKSINVGAPSSFMQTMDRAGLRLPTTLSHESIPVLSGMAAMWSYKDSNPYQELIDLIHDHGEIELFAEY